MYDYDLIVIGCGPAGEKAATQAAFYRKRTAIIERAPRPGGAMVNTGTIPSKALRETALLGSAFRRRPLPGTDFSIDHTVSVPRFMARRHLIEQQEHDRIERSIDRQTHDVRLRLVSVASVGSPKVSPTVCRDAPIAKGPNVPRLIASAKKTCVAFMRLQPGNGRIHGGRAKDLQADH